MKLGYTDRFRGKVGNGRRGNSCKRVFESGVFGPGVPMRAGKEWGFSALRVGLHQLPSVTFVLVWGQNLEPERGVITTDSKRKFLGNSDFPHQGVCCTNEIDF